MKTIFAGTPPFAAVSLAALLAAGHEIVLVLTQPDRPAGRGMKPRISAVKELAQARGLPLYQPERLRDEPSQAPLRRVAADVMVVAAYGLILPQAILDQPRLGCINVHASLLPRWRGAAPIQRAIAAGDRETGISIMRMDAGLDTGPILERRRIAIAADDSAATLEHKLAELGAALLVEVLRGLELAVPQAQEAAGVTYAAKIDKAEAVLDWRRGAEELERQVRAFDPYPGASTTFAGAALKVWRAAVASRAGQPGTVLSADREGIVVACGEGSLKLIELQRAGAKRLPVKDFLSGVALRPGERLGAVLAQGNSP